MIQDRLKALRSEMAKRGISLYVVPTADFHESEYVGEHFKARKYITGFTGSAGTAVITMDEAGLWTDGRYFVQAAAQLKDTTVKLFKIGEEGVPTVDEYINDTLSDGGVIGFDGRVVNAAWGKRLSEIAKEKHGSMYVNEDLIDLIWTDRPPMSKAPVMIFDNIISFIDGSISVSANSIAFLLYNRFSKCISASTFSAIAIYDTESSL